MVVYLLQGVYRALDSGPLEAWYVDHALAADRDADIETGLSRSGVVLGVAIAGGALVSGGLVALGPVGAGDGADRAGAASPSACRSCRLVAVAAADDRGAPRPRVSRALVASVRGVPAAIGGALGLLRRSRVIAALIAVEVFWGFGMVTFETLMPVRLAEVVGDAGPGRGADGPGRLGGLAGLGGRRGAGAAAGPADRRAVDRLHPAHRAGRDGGRHGAARRPGRA